MQRFLILLILLGSSAFALSVLFVGLMLAQDSLAAALIVMALFAVMAIGVIVLFVREALRPKPIPRTMPEPKESAE
ncbi:hypothetical protein ETD86_21550 [Nonomuraea turkmeniaca]|uniref:Uncharacterized protein n=1 Tax=Nonomuraea turkmeniaca TaxID=103838 RepID=A0A5S4FGH3_9ACTN|nr:hypothetical protein [Nonomuraea turkmeniaca]TMR18538.1 hypothetical protein ETD86_21550 [Nonomuraea turkmeniaca]